MKQPRRKGWMMLDVLTGLMLLAALAVMLIVAITGRARSLYNLSQQRAAMDIARETLAQLRTGGDVPTADRSANITVHRTSKKVGDLEWVEVQVTREGRHASLVGLARANGGSP